jgi:hypothetical protein
MVLFRPEVLLVDCALQLVKSILLKMFVGIAYEKEEELEMKTLYAIAVDFGFVLKVKRDTLRRVLACSNSDCLSIAHSANVCPR